MQASLRLGVVIRLDKPKALERGRSVLFILLKAQDSLPYTFFLLNGDMELYRNGHLFI
jgi:hypothetical protein